MSGIDSYTKLLLHLDDNVIDSEATPKTVTNNNVTFSDTVKKWAYAGSFNGASSYLSIPSSADFNFETGDFTIDCWIRFNIVNTSQMFVGTGAPGGAYGLEWCYRPSDSTLYFNCNAYVESGDGPIVARFSCPFTPVVDVWYHLVVERYGSSCLMFINGVSQTITQIVAWGTLTSFPEAFLVGVGAYTVVPRYLNGYMDEPRISKGVARWTSGFTPPTAPYSLESKQRARAIIIA